MGKTPVEQRKAVRRAAAGSDLMTSGIERKLGRFVLRSGRDRADTLASEADGARHAPQTVNTGRIPAERSDPRPGPAPFEHVAPGGAGAWTMRVPGKDAATAVCLTSDISAHALGRLFGIDSSTRGKALAGGYGCSLVGD